MVPAPGGSAADTGQNLRGDGFRVRDAVDRRRMARVLDVREQIPDVADAFLDDVGRGVGAVEVGRDGLRLTDPAAGLTVDGEFLGRAQVVVEVREQGREVVGHASTFGRDGRDCWGRPSVGMFSAAAGLASRMSTIEEKRVFAAKAGRTRVFVGSAVGVAAVSVSDDLVGEFGVEYRCVAADVAGAPGQVAVATDEDVVLLGEQPLELGFGPATAVGFRDGAVVAAGESGRVAAAMEPDEWVECGAVDGAVRAIDGGLVGTSEGVYRVGEEDLTRLGLDAVADVADVADGRTPLAATDRGVFRFDAEGEEWERVLDGDATLVAGGADGRGHAVAGGSFYAREGPGEWQRATLPVDALPVGVAYGDGTYAVTDGGIFLVDAGDGWRRQPIGLRGVAGCAVASE